MNLYEEIKIWERPEKGKAICYRCLRLVSSGFYYIQSADYYNKSTNHLELDLQFAELLIDEAPEIRTAGYTTIEEAVLVFKAEFEGTRKDE